MCQKISQHPSPCAPPVIASFPAPDLGWGRLAARHQMGAEPRLDLSPKSSLGEKGQAGALRSRAPGPPSPRTIVAAQGRVFTWNIVPRPQERLWSLQTPSENRLYTPRRRQVPTNQQESGPPRKVPELGMLPQRPSWQVSPGEVESTNSPKHPVVTRPHPH